MKLKRIMAIALCLCMVFGTMNFTVSAEDHSDVIASVTSEVIKDDLTLNVKLYIEMILSSQLRKIFYYLINFKFL